MKKRTMAEFMKNCREIMAAGKDRDKEQAIDDEAEHLLDEIFEDMPEIRAIRRKEDALDRKREQEQTKLDDEWDRIKAAKKAKLIEKAMLAGKAA